MPAKRQRALLNAVSDALPEAGVPAADKGALSSVAVKWTDHKTAEDLRTTPMPPSGMPGTTPWAKDYLFFATYVQAPTMMGDEGVPDPRDLGRAVAAPRSLWRRTTQAIGAADALLRRSSRRQRRGSGVSPDSVATLSRKRGQVCGVSNQCR
jgi:hypothetical protein